MIFKRWWGLGVCLRAGGGEMSLLASKMTRRGPEEAGQPCSLWGGYRAANPAFMTRPVCHSWTWEWWVRKAGDFPGLLWISEARSWEDQPLTWTRDWGDKKTGCRRGNSSWSTGTRLQWNDPKPDRRSVCRALVKWSAVTSKLGWALRC